MGFIQEFKEFAMRGNVVDMAVGIVIGAAFGKIVSSFVSGVVMPPIGMITGGVDFSEKKFILQAAADAKPEKNLEAVTEVAISYGAFLNTVIDFVIVALAIFCVIKMMNSMKKKEEVAPASPPAPPKEQVLLEEIRDLLAKKN